jgi:hypothetical protein
MPFSPKTCLNSLAIATAFAVCASCISVSYDGESGDPKAKRSDVQVFFDKSKIPVKEYKVLGTAVVSGPSIYSYSEVQVKLVDFARKQGADGVLVVSVDKQDDGTARGDQILGTGSTGSPMTEGGINQTFVDQAQNTDPMAGKRSSEKTEAITITAQLLAFPKVEPAPKGDVKAAN